MKRIWIMLLALSLVLCGCGGDVELSLERSDRHTDREIRAAAETVKENFFTDDSFRLLEVRYEDVVSLAEEEFRAEEYEEGDVIVLLTKFHVDHTHRGPMTPGRTYDNYKWILVKTLTGWEVKDSGYA